MTQPFSLLRRLQIAAFWAAGFGLISAVSRPAARGQEWLTSIGVSDALAPAVAYGAPVLAAAFAIGLGPVLLQRLSRPWRLAALAGLGAVCGAILSFCLDAFARVDVLLGWVGPLREPTVVDVIAWTAAAMSVVYGVLAQGVAAFGSSALRALAVEEPAPGEDCVDVRRRDRGQLAWAALGMVGHGVIFAAAVLSQSALDLSPAAQGGIAVLALLGAAFFTWSSARLWVSFDELQRRTVMDAYAWSAILVTPFLFGWVVLEGFGRMPPLDAYALLVALLLIQTVLTVVVQMKVGATSGAEKAA